MSVEKIISDFGTQGARRMDELFTGIDKIKLNTLSPNEKALFLQKIQGDDDGCNQVIASAISKLGMAKRKKLNKKEVEGIENAQIVLVLASDEVSVEAVKAFMLKMVVAHAEGEHLELWHDAIDKICAALAGLLVEYKQATSTAEPKAKRSREEDMSTLPEASSEPKAKLQ